MKISLVIFRNDLRVHDHQALREALNQPWPVCALYLDDLESLSSPYHFARRASKRDAFLYQTLHQLKARLKDYGVPFIYLNHTLEDGLALIQTHVTIEHIYLHYTDGEEERLWDLNLLKALPQKVTFYEDKTLFTPHELPFSLARLPKSFTGFRKRIEHLTPRAPLDPPNAQPYWHPPFEGDIPKTNENVVFPAGEMAAFERVNHYFFKTHAIKQYKDTRNGMLLDDASSKFSPYLANGSLSVRWLYDALKRYEALHGQNASTYWLYFELLWRDYFSFLSQKYRARLYAEGGLHNQPIVWKDDPKAWAKIEQAQTGYPMVDANLRMLYETGYMSNRGRQNVASFITKNLRLDWRLGAAWFEHHLLDYDVASNYANWAYVAGVGTDQRDFRYFDVMKQGILYDPKAKLLEVYCPELNAVPANKRYELPRLDPLVYQDYQLTYPKPMVDFKRSLQENEPYFIKKDA